MLAKKTSVKFFFQLEHCRPKVNNYKIIRILNELLRILHDLLLPIGISLIQTKLMKQNCELLVTRGLHAVKP